MLSLLRLECKQKNYANPFQICIFLFLSLLIWNWNDKYVHTLPQFPRKPYPIPDQNGPSVYPFQIKTVQKPYPIGAAHTYMAYIREYPTAPSAPPPPQGLKYSAVLIKIHICNNKSSVYVQLFDLSQPKAVGKMYRSSRFLASNPVMEPWKWNLFVSQYLTLHYLFSTI